MATSNYSIEMPGQYFAGDKYAHTKVYYDIETSDTKIKIRVKWFVTVVSHVGDGTLSVEQELYVDGQRVASKSGSWSRGTWKNWSGETITLDRRESNRDVLVHYQVNVGVQSRNFYKTHTFDPYPDRVLTPSWKPSGLTIAREGNGHRAKWDVPKAAVDQNRINRFTGQLVRWRLYYKSGSTSGEMTDDNKKGTGVKEEYEAYAEYPYSYDGAAISRSSFYPLNSLVASKVNVWVRGYHRRSNNGKDLWGDWAGPATYAFEKPKKPTVSWEYDEASARATVTIETDAGDGKKERYDTRYRVEVKKADGKYEIIQTAVSSRSTKFSKTFDLSRFLTNLTAGKGITVTCYAYARGIAGDSETAEKSRAVFMPSAPTLGAVTVDRKGTGGVVRVPVSVNATNGSLQLQRRHGENGSWSDVSGAVDNRVGCKALYDTWDNVWPNGQVKGEKVYYRVKSTRDNFTMYSAAKEAACLFTAKPPFECRASVGIVNIVPREDGRTALVVVGFTDSTENTGTELSWSERDTAWDDTQGPTVYKVEGADATSKSQSYAKTKSIYVAGLEAGKTYYVRARRYRAPVDSGDKECFSGYTARQKLVAASAEGTTCEITKIEPQIDGTSAYITVKYSGAVTTTGTEISYSEVAGAWSGAGVTPTASNVASSGKSGTHRFLLSGLTSGKRYYLEARRYLVSGSTTTYGPYSKQQVLISDSAEGDPCGIVSLAPEADGHGAVLVVGFGNDGNTGTQVEWTTDANAWQATTPPVNALASWENDATRQSTSWAATQTVYIRGIERNATYYVKARRYRDSGGNTTYGTRSNKHSFNTVQSTALDDSCSVISATPDEDGHGAVLVVGWNENSANDGTEISWSPDADAWISNEGPSTLQATWRDEESADADFGGTQSVHLRGMEPGTSYYVRARRYETEAGTFSPYSQTVTVAMPTSGESGSSRCGIVSLVGGDDGTSAVVVVGWAGERSGCEVSWTENPNGWESSEPPSSSEFAWADTQNKSATVYTPTSDTEVYEDPEGEGRKVYYTRSGSGTPEDPYVYTEVEEPVTADIASYYEAASEWQGTGTFYIVGLEEGATYYVRARTYREGTERSWSAYSDTLSVTPVSAPEAVVLAAPGAVARGESIELYWTVQNEVEQTEYHVHEVGDDGTALEDGEGALCHASVTAERYGDADSIDLYVMAGCGGGLTRSNDVSVGIADVPSLELACEPVLAAKPATFEAYTDDPSCSLLATCFSQGVTEQAPDGDRDQLAGESVWTEPMMPSWDGSTWGGTLLRSQLSDAVDDAQDALDEAQDALDGATAGDQSYADAEAALESAQAEQASAKADLDAAQAALDALEEGDEGYDEALAARDAALEDFNEADAALASAREDYDAAVADGGYSEQVAARGNAASALESAQADLAAHPADGTVYVCSATIPNGSRLLDGGSYSVTARAVEGVAGLSSETATCTFSVEWAHQAPTPSDAVSLAADAASRSVEVTFAEPDDWAEGDSYELYRATRTGHVLVASDLAADAVVTDRFAPYGSDSLHYRIACRTADGDVEFADYGYIMEAGGLRFDWPGGFVEMPFNVKLSDSYSKDYESRPHLDGKVNGYYNRAVTHTGDYSADVVRADEDTRRAIAELGEHPGAVFCRASGGVAFQCNADVGGVELDYASVSVGASFPVTEMALTEQFMAERDSGE